MKKILKLNKESLVVLNDKEMSQINGGLAFLSLWGSNCYDTNPQAHQCCQPKTPGDPLCGEQWSQNIPCDPVGLMPYGEAMEIGGAIHYLDNNGAIINVPGFDADTAPYHLVGGPPVSV